MQAEGAWSSQSWAASRRVATALRGALHKAPLYPVTEKRVSYTYDIIAASLLGMAANSVNLVTEVVYEQRRSGSGMNGLCACQAGIACVPCPKHSPALPGMACI
jgi:hypothetical protein